MREEAELYRLGTLLVARGLAPPDLPPARLRHVLRGLWDTAGHVGPNVGGYPVASLVTPFPLATAVSREIARVTGRPSPPRPVASGYWVGASGRACLTWVRYLYDDAALASVAKRAQASALLVWTP